LILVSESFQSTNTFRIGWISHWFAGFNHLLCD
jgi:hypothetical protein